MNEKLYQELVDECDRLTKLIEEEEFNSEGWKAAYSRKLDILEKMNSFNKVETEYYTKQEERRVEEEHNKQMLELEEKKLEQHKELDQRRIAYDLIVEKEKQKITWQRIAFEMAKILLPLGISAAVRHKERRDMYDFEEHGRITSTVGRQYRLMDLFWKK